MQPAPAHQKIKAMVMIERGRNNDVNSDFTACILCPCGRLVEQDAKERRPWVIWITVRE
jgi:hypothetical protein